MNSLSPGVSLIGDGTIQIHIQLNPWTYSPHEISFPTISSSKLSTSSKEDMKSFLNVEW